MARQIHFLAAWVIAAACLAGCRSDQPTDVSKPGAASSEPGKSQSQMADDDEDGDDDGDRNGDKDRDGDGDEIRHGDEDRHRDGGDERPDIPSLPSAADFVAEIDNPYLAFARGKIFHYESETEDGI